MLKLLVVSTDVLPIVSTALTITELLRQVEKMVSRLELSLLAKLPQPSEMANDIRRSVCIATCDPSENSTVATRSA